MFLVCVFYCCFEWILIVLWCWICTTRRFFIRVALGFFLSTRDLLWLKLLFCLCLWVVLCLLVWWIVWVVFLCCWWCLILICGVNLGLLGMNGVMWGWVLGVIWMFFFGFFCWCWLCMCWWWWGWWLWLVWCLNVWMRGWEMCEVCFGGYANARGGEGFGVN